MTKKIFRLPAIRTKSLKNHLSAQDTETGAHLPGKFQPVISRVLKVHDLPTFDAVEMVVRLGVRIKALRVTVTFAGSHDASIAEDDERPVDRVE